MTSSINTPSGLPTAPLPSPAPRPIRALQLEVVKGPDAGLTHRATLERIVIGTARNADFVLTDRTVSRFHLELAIDGDTVELKDLGSKNHTVLDTVALVAAKLTRPVIVTLGETELRIDLLRETVAIELATEEQFGTLVGISPLMRSVFARLQRAVDQATHVLIEGERGVGKHAAAAALHDRGARRDAPFDVVDCRMPALEVEAALFGSGDHAGMLARCHGGTLVFDEIGELSRTAQRLLARCLEDRLVRRLRSDTTAPADVHVIALSRRNLRIDVNADRFLPDLFELVGATRIRLPSLREHPEDIPLLVEKFLATKASPDPQAATRLRHAETTEQLRAAPWPGNVRELRAYVEAAVTRDRDDDGPEPEALVDDALPLRTARDRWLRYFERRYVGNLLERTEGNISAAAILADVDRVYMHRLVTRSGLRELLERIKKRTP